MSSIFCSEKVFNKNRRLPRLTTTDYMDIMCTWTYVRGGGAIYTSSTALMHPSFSGLLVTCAYLPHTTLPEGVTRPRSEQFTSMIVPLVITPD